MERENQRVVLTKRMIREALLHLMETRSIRNISVRELCETAGINRSTFYKHYGAPENVLQEIQSELIQHIIDLAEDADKTVSTPTFLERVCEYLWENRRMHKVLLSSQTGSEGNDVFRMTSNALWTVKTFRPELADIDPVTDQAAMLFVEAGCYAVFRWWLLEDVEKTPKEIARTLCKLIGIEATN